VAAGYGVKARGVSDREELEDALASALADDAPSLVQVDVAPGMALL
jgi:thiamine pyrophosphate-dependent acetolactate synthase large subunit-like protein